MSGWRGILGGALALVALQTLVQPAAAGRVGGLFVWASDKVRRFMDPTVPAIPDHSKPHEPFDPFGAFASAIGGAIKGAIPNVGGAVSSAVSSIPGAGVINPVLGLNPGHASLP